MSDLRFTPPRPRPIDPAALGTRKLDGSYPFRSHRTCAEWMAAALEQVA